MKTARGHTLLGVLVAAAIMAIVMTAFLSMFKSQMGASRKIAALGGITDLSHGLDVLFGGPECATTGSYLDGATAASVTVGGTCTAPAGYCLSLTTMKFANGTLAITSGVDAPLAALIQPYAITSLTMTGLGGNGPNGTGFKYPFQVGVEFSHRDGGPPALPLKKFVMVYTNAANRVIGACFNGAGGGGTRCTRIRSGYAGWGIGEVKRAACPSGADGVYCDVTITWGGHTGGHPAVWNADRSECTWGPNYQTGISGEVTAECCYF